MLKNKHIVLYICDLGLISLTLTMHRKMGILQHTVNRFEAYDGFYGIGLCTGKTYDES